MSTAHQRGGNSYVYVRCMCRVGGLLMTSITPTKVPTSTTSVASVQQQQQQQQQQQSRQRRRMAPH